MDKIHCFYLVFTIILVLFIVLLNNKEKFEEKIESPTILKIEKKNTDVLIEWENNNEKITEFIILYIDILSIDKGVWVTDSIKCNKKTCKIILNNLLGEKYNIAVLSKFKNKTSKIKKIISFSENENYILNKTIKKSNVNSNTIASNKNTIASNTNTIASNTNTIASNTNTEEKEKMGSPSKSEKDKESPGPSVEPHFDCSKRISRVNIKTKEDLENSEVKYNCKEDIEIGELRGIINKKPFYHNLWEKIF